MTYLVDAQLPRRLARWLSAAGYDALHTHDLPGGNRTTDTEIAARADADGRVLVTKDADFVASHVVHGRPQRLWLVSTGNLSNADLEPLVSAHIAEIADLLRGASFIEMTRHAVIRHR